MKRLILSQRKQIEGKRIPGNEEDIDFVQKRLKVIEKEILIFKTNFKSIETTLQTVEQQYSNVDNLRICSRSIQYILNKSSEKQYTQEHNLSLNLVKFKNESQFFKYDDFIQTRSIDDSNKYNNIVANLGFDCNLSILALLRFLLTINQCKKFTLRQMLSRSLLQLNKVPDLVTNIVEILFQISNLQKVNFSCPHEFIPFLTQGLNKLNIQKLSLSKFKFSGDLILANAKEIAELFQLVYKFPHLCSFQIGKICLNDHKLYKSFNLLLTRVKAAHFSLDQIPTNFSFILNLNNLLDLNLTIIPQTYIIDNYQIDDLMASIQTANQLQSLRLNISRKQQKNHSLQLYNSKNEVKNLNVTKQKRLQDLKLLQRFSQFSKLETIKLTIQSDQLIYDSYLTLLKQNCNIKYFTFYCTSDKQLDLKDLYEIINNLNQIKRIQLKTNQVLIKYELLDKDSSLYDFQFYLICSKLITQDKQFQPNKFFFNKVNRIKLDYSIKSLEQLDVLLQSVGSCKSVNFIELNIKSNPSLVNNLCKTPCQFPDMKYFGHFTKLKQLQELNLNTPIDQGVLNSMKDFLLKLKNLKKFSFKRQNHNQYYLDYCSLFFSLSSSQSIEEIYMNTSTGFITKPSDQHAQLWNNMKEECLYKPLASLLENTTIVLKFINFDEDIQQPSAFRIIFKALNQSDNNIYIQLGKHDLKEYAKNEKEQEPLQNFISCVQNKKVYGSFKQYPFTLQQLYKQQKKLVSSYLDLASLSDQISNQNSSLSLGSPSLSHSVSSLSSNSSSYSIYSSSSSKSDDKNDC